MKTTLIKHFSRHLRMFFEHWVVGTIRQRVKKHILARFNLGKQKWAKGGVVGADVEN
jgi:hypothetical protein